MTWPATFLKQQPTLRVNKAYDPLYAKQTKLRKNRIPKNNGVKLKKKVHIKRDQEPYPHLEGNLTRNSAKLFFNKVFATSKT